ncbi:ribonuclease R [Serratia symbiotica str. 'Cinara cedri']|nr:ribonuclease R [Serratia symbiotica str. 'Cinara cedri']
MSQDPFIEREAEKYKSPIPSREYIIAHLEKRETPASRNMLFKELDLIGVDQLEALRRRLRAMERDGQLILTRRQCYALPERLDLLRGTVIGHRDGYGFLRIEGSKDDYYLSVEQMKIAIHDDVVLARVFSADSKGRREARIVRVLIPKIHQIIGRFFVDTNIGFVVPDDSRFSFDILVEEDSINRAIIGYMVVIELIQRPTRRTKAIGKIIEILGNNIDTDMVVDIALRTYNIPHSWSSQVDAQVAKLSEQVPEVAKKDRVDLRKLPLVTIDSEDARDFDDAVYCEKKEGGGWRLWVAIADVSYYVRPDTLLDDVARNRATSVYFPSQVIPMLPEVLSNGLCSLNPQVDRLCMVCEMTISAQGQLLASKFYEAVMKSHARLTYNKVWRILQGDKDLCEDYYPLITHLKKLHAMYLILKKARIARGGITFETEEAKFIFNAAYRIESIEPIVRNDAHRLIEECMIMANVASAIFVEKYNEPALFRVHDRPSNDHIFMLRSILKELGLTLEGGDKPQPKDYVTLINQVTKRPDYQMLQTMLLRSMKQAIYDPENRGHFGLALTSYAHFTSPIRRYPDLTLHRAIKYQCNKERYGELKERWTITGGWHSEFQEILRLGVHCSMAERRADEAIRNVIDWLKCDYMQDQVGSIFYGIIVSVTSFGFFVRLNNLFIDGLVHISSLDNDYYCYDNIGQRLIGESTGVVYRLGDTVKIRIAAVHMDERKMDFILASSHCELHALCKTKRNRSKNIVLRTVHDNIKISSVRTRVQSKRRRSKLLTNFELNSTLRKDIDNCANKVKCDKRLNAKNISYKAQKKTAALKINHTTNNKGSK